LSPYCSSYFSQSHKFTPIEALIAATAGVAKLFIRSHELGMIKEGYYGYCILANGNTTNNIEVPQNHDIWTVIVVNGRVYKAGLKAYNGQPLFCRDNNGPVIIPDFPEVNMQMQKKY
jgi:imidazolonepropionase-like amidohydrolase